MSNSNAQDKALSVTQLLRRMKNLLEVQVGDVWVEGEVSNLRKQGSGHWYFSLKDSGAQISCAMFSARRRQGSDELVDGAKVRVFAEASVYEARGQLQIIVQKVELAGAGDLQAKFEALKKKLKDEGLFEADRKRPIPKFPKVIGLVTSGSGAALQDMLNVVMRRAPWVQPVLLPVRVQGQGAERGIAAAIDRLGNPGQSSDPRCDVIIVGRGGGSIEDLWNFNEEIVARAIARCPIPIISAVGHEIDFTIADFVADLRAPTPSAAAELAVVDGEELIARIQQSGRRMVRQLQERLRQGRLSLDAYSRGILQRDGERLLREPAMRMDSVRARLSQSLKISYQDRARKLRELRSSHRAHQPHKVLERKVETLGVTAKRLERSVTESLDQHAERLVRMKGLLRALGPESAFQRGFSITMNKDGSIVRSAKDLNEGDVMTTKWSDGERRSRVEPD